LRLSSPAIHQDNHLPERYSRDGENISPPLEWGDVPSSAKELVVFLENVTPATQEPFAQWILYGLGTDRQGLEEGFHQKREPEEGLAHGKNDVGNLGYDGPQGTISETIHLRFRLLALDAPLGLDPGADREAVLKAADGHVVEEAQLPVDYRRSA
jgi:hypothetical protein